MMDTNEILVVIGGAVAIAFIIWYFFGKREVFAAKIVDGGRQEIDVTVKGGYSPEVIELKRGIPVRINFYRDDSSSCSERVVFGDLGIVRDLPAYETTSIEFTPEKAGEFPFTCGMGMLHGKLIVT